MSTRLKQFHKRLCQLETARREQLRRRALPNVLVAPLPSALFCERFSLGASWVFSIQQVLLSGKRPLLPSNEGSLG